MGHRLAGYQHATRDEQGWVHDAGWEVRFLFEPRDLWIGVYWDRLSTGVLSVYVCLVPLFPVNVLVWRG